MKLTKAMKDRVKEEIQKAVGEEEELSDDMLEEVTGGRALTDVEQEWVNRFQDKWSGIPGFNVHVMVQISNYGSYISRLPEGSPVELFDLSIDWKEKLSQL